MAGCQSAFESVEDLDIHIAVNIHTIIEEENRTSNDIARLHLMESVRSTSITARHQTIRVYEHQENQQITLTESPKYKYFSRVG